MVLNLKYWVEPYFMNDWISLCSTEERADLSYLVSRLKDLYGDKRSGQRKKEDFRNVKQEKGDTVSQYTAKKLKRYREAYPGDAVTDEGFLEENLSGLAKNYREKIAEKEPLDYLEAMQIATRLEKVRISLYGNIGETDNNKNPKEKNTPQVEKKQYTSHSQNLKPQDKKPWKSLTAEEKKWKTQQFRDAKEKNQYPYIDCNRCKKRSDYKKHLAVDCPQYKCPECDQQGHHVINCPKNL